MVTSINKLKQYMEVVPVLLFLCHFVAYSIYVSSIFYETEYILTKYYGMFKHLFECSLITIIVLGYTALKDRWGLIPKICLGSLFLLWLNNLPTIVFGLEYDGYFVIFASIIYVTSLILSLWVLTRR